MRVIQSAAAVKMRSVGRGKAAEVSALGKRGAPRHSHLILSLTSAKLPPRRAVAQTGSALLWGGRGRRFKSSQPDHLFSLARPRCSTLTRNLPHLCILEKSCIRLDQGYYETGSAFAKPLFADVELKEAGYWPYH